MCFACSGDNGGVDQVFSERKWGFGGQKHITRLFLAAGMRFLVPGKRVLIGKCAANTSASIEPQASPCRVPIPTSHLLPYSPTRAPIPARPLAPTQSPECAWFQGPIQTQEWDEFRFRDVVLSSRNQKNRSSGAIKKPLPILGTARCLDEPAPRIPHG